MTELLLELYVVSDGAFAARTVRQALQHGADLPLGGFDLGMERAGGDAQRLCLTRLLHSEFGLLILDEPFVGLDPVAAHAFKQQMRALCDRGGAVFFSTHVLDVAEKLCDKVAIIKNGRLAAFGDTDAVRGDGSLEELFLELVEK